MKFKVSIFRNAKRIFIICDLLFCFVLFLLYTPMKVHKKVMRGHMPKALKVL